MTRRPLTTAAINAARAAINAASGVFQELALPDDGSQTLRYRLSPYGEFPAYDVSGNAIMQVVDRTAAETLAANYNSLATKIATFFRGVPIYEGHADDPGWAAKNPGHRASAVGRIKSIEAGDDGIYVTAVLNAAGVALLAGEAPQYTGHSPYWRLAEIPGRTGHFRPILLWSDALTNTPNILTNTIALNELAGLEMELELPGDDEASPAAAAAEEPEENNDNDTTDTTMKLSPEALAALGFAPEAEPTAEEISAAIIKLASDQATAAAAMATAEGETTAANASLQAAITELAEFRGQAVTRAIDEAIATGRITEAERPAWTTALNTSYPTEAAKLQALMPTLNTVDRVGNLERRQAAIADVANAAARITTAVTEYAAEKGMDITTPEGWTRAYDATRAAKPELFAKP
jgi:hypothetical protein